MPAERQSFRNRFLVRRVLPETGSAMVTILSETSSTATQWSTRKESLSATSVIPSFFSWSIESKYW